MACDPETLLAQAACFSCLSKQELEAIIAQLLCNLVTLGGGGGVNSGMSNPVLPPNNPTSSALYVNLATGSLWYWDPNQTAWYALISA